MKILVLLVTLLALNSCNTFIGLGRDTKEGYEWTKKKMQKEETAEDAGLPVY
jgi:predicted small secreted protein